jgi:hypothetical protein
VLGGVIKSESAVSGLAFNHIRAREPGEKCPAPNLFLRSLPEED